MMSSELTNLCELVRRGDLDAARELAIPDDDRAVAAIYLALAAGDTELALRHAVECFDQGRALRVVAATIVAFGPQDQRWKQAADAVAIMDALTAAAAAHPGDLGDADR